MYLLDTNVVSELRRARPHPAVRAWLASVPENRLHLSAVTLGEIQAGIEIARAQDAAKADQIEAWAIKLEGAHRILLMDGPAFRTWAKLMRNKSSVLVLDAMIAATAIVHDLMVVTRNIGDYESLGVEMFDPFAFG